MNVFHFRRPEWYDADKIFDCGQCFRFKKTGGVWRGVAYGTLLELRQTDTEIECRAECGELTGSQRLEHYLGLDRDYAVYNIDISDRLADYPFMNEAMRRSRGVVLLNQQPWETLVSFIISQNNNIPRIKGIIEGLSNMCGKPVADGYRAFPEPGKILELGTEGLKPLHPGYRDRYIIDAARLVYDGALDLEELKSADTDSLMKALLSVNGVGPKVASCIALFAYARYELFPVDTWIKKALKDHFGGASPLSFGPFAGIAQQYIFYSQTH
ncbi:MAG: DNA-3-methyladenine glycosylase 2 family protein [Clostridia bacterium]|nr:DNA-3-methyladenine glycosylase 2 family protein [Clostridia bacterium]